MPQWAVFYAVSTDESHTTWAMLLVYFFEFRILFFKFKKKKFWHFFFNFLIFFSFLKANILDQLTTTGILKTSFCRTFSRKVASEISLMLIDKSWRNKTLKLAEKHFWRIFLEVWVNISWVTYKIKNNNNNHSVGL